MATEWVIAAAADRVQLDDQNRAEITFTVTNQGQTPDRAVLEAVPGDGADRKWFSVEEPRRLVPGGGSIACLMTAKVPPGTPAGSYWVQGRVYSAEAAPEETSRLSDRVAFEVRPIALAKKRPWWPYAVAAALAVVVIVVVAVLVSGDDGASTPDVTNRSLAEAEQILTGNGLTIGAIAEVVDPAKDNGIVVGQVPGPGETVRDERTVDLSIVANPVPEHSLAITVTGNGVVSGNGIACPGQCAASLTEGAEVTLTATATASIFGGWGGRCEGTTASTCTFTMAGADVAVSARFLPLPAATTAPPDPTPVVPNVIGLSAATARGVLQSAGFAVDQATAVDNLCNSIGQVMRQQPTGGTTAPRGSRVTITIGVRPPPPRLCP